MQTITHSIKQPVTQPVTQNPLVVLQQALGYYFKNAALLDRALTHKSRGAINNERLEFLGDSVLGLVTADFLYTTLPGLAEGDMSRVRAGLVCEDALADVGARLNVGPNMRVVEYGSSPAVRRSTIADTMEALFGAIYLDGGLEAVREVIYVQLTYLITNRKVSLQKDPKTQLQEHLQQNGYRLPEYETIASEDLGAATQYKVECRIPELNIVTNGVGRTRKDAEMQAAKSALPRCKNRR